MTKDIKSPKLVPAIVVIFGITGDLSKRKLLPALYHLFKQDLLDEHTVILGITRQEVIASDLIKDVELCVNEIDGVCDPIAVTKLRACLEVLQMDITKGSEYDRLRITLDKIESDQGMCMNRLYYLSIPPQVTDSIVTLLGDHKLNTSCMHGTAATRLLIEKPFGYDLNSAQELIDVISKQFKESQIFRIDHYLAKETVQNIITFRFNNIFEHLWNAKYVSHILFSATETIGVEGRSIFYEQVGALRDIIQSHLLQLLAVTTLDLPTNLSSQSLHEAKLALLNKVVPVPDEKVDKLAIRGQYSSYRKEVNNLTSEVETFAALELTIDNERWKNVPFLFRTGKSLAKKLTEVRVVFKTDKPEQTPNILVFRIQPNEGIELDLQAKKPGFEHDIQTTKMDFAYQQTFDDHEHPNAYERVLVDAVKGDHTLFSTSKEVMAAWRIVDPVLKVWGKNPESLTSYKDGSWGPDSANTLVRNVGTTWMGE